MSNRLPIYSLLVVAYVFTVCSSTASLPTSYVQWLTEHSLPVDGSGLGAGSASPAQDGIANSLKFGLGLDPWQPGLAGRLTGGKLSDSGSEYLSITYQRPYPHLPGLTYVTEFSSDLVNWTPGGTQIPGGITNNLQSLIARDAEAISTVVPMRFFRLRVKLAEGPEITSPPTAQSVASGGTATFGVAATGTPTITYQWRKNGLDIPGATGSTLTLTDVTTADAGNFSVVATNAEGSVASVAVPLSVVLESPTVSVALGPDTFTWTFDKPVTQGVFVDGQPWIVRPSTGVKLLAVSPARQNGVAVEGYSGASIPVQNINMTVINPPIGYYYNGSTPVIVNAFGWDSRGCIRYGLGNSYSSSLAWDGTTPLDLAAGDAITSAKSRLVNINDTALQAVAVCTVLESPPPVDAFRPGFTRTAARRANPEWFTLSQVIDVTPYLIPAPATDLFNHTPIAIPTAMAANRLTNLLPGPSILNIGLNDARSANADYNNSGEGYGASVAQLMGDLAVGSLAGWLTPAQRQTCQIRFIQRAVDTYETLQGGLILTHAGGHLVGYGALLTVAGRMLNHPGMLSVNNGFNGKSPEAYFGDYSEAFCLVNDVNTVGANEPPLGSKRRIDFRSAGLNLNLSSTGTGKKLSPSVTAATANSLTVPSNFEWPTYRAAREIQNLKLRIVSGAGAGPAIYTVTGITNYNGGVTNSATGVIKGGTLSVKPNWQNGNPDPTSGLTFSVAAQNEMPRWGFKASGLNVATYDVNAVDLSPNADYSDINAGAHLTLFVAMYALDAEGDYKGGLDHWLTTVGTIPGYGEVVFGNGNARNVSYPGAYSGDARNFLSGLWKGVLTKPSVNKPFVYTDGTVNGLPIVPAGTKLWNEP